MRQFLGRPGAKTALGLGQLSNRAATLAVWATLQFELAFALPLYVVGCPLTLGARSRPGLLVSCHAGGVIRFKLAGQLCRAQPRGIK